ncbi:dihydroorotase [Tenacibaculum xiamenense]|uniref:dihydroorotase n=1 Tax=Tenacibaculum xiamenense TaxID=1261553 RepID=UPI00389605BB
MKNYIVLGLFIILFSGFGYAQSSDTSVKVGDVFLVGEVANDNYKHIKFPKDNFIVKRGGTVNYSNVRGQKVEVTSIKENSKGDLIATISLSSKKYFFRSHKYVKVNITDALNNKELLKI